MDAPSPPSSSAPYATFEPPSSAREELERRILAIQRPHKHLLWLYGIKSLATLVFAPIVFVPFFFKYHTLRYRIDSEGISAAWGILFRRETHLTYKRIQDIHVKRNIIERWLGIATVEIQTASGSTSAELSLEGMDDYDGVRDFLYERMRGHELAGAAKTAVAPPPASRAPVAGLAQEAETLALLRQIRDDLDSARRALERGA